MLFLRLVCLVVILSFVGGEEENYLRVLNDGDFEHLTQISSGMTTGDWLIMMAPAGSCSKCEQNEIVLRKVALEFQGRVNIAILDRENSKLTLRRFNVKSSTIKFFRQGYQWEYKGLVAQSNIGHFIEGGYRNQNGYRAPKPIDFLDAWQEDFVNELKAAYKEKRLPERNTFLITLGGLLVGLLVLFCMLAPKSKPTEEESKSAKRQSKKKK